MTARPTRLLPGRRDVIARLLEPYFHVSTLVQSNPAPSFEPAPGLRPNLLMGSWADPATGENKLIVVISQVADGERKAAELREMVMEEAPEDPSKATRTRSPANDQVSTCSCSAMSAE